MKSKKVRKYSESTPNLQGGLFMLCKELLQLFLDNLLHKRIIEENYFYFAERDLPAKYLNSRLSNDKTFNYLTIERCLMVLKRYLGLDGKNVRNTQVKINQNINEFVSLLEKYFEYDFSDYMLDTIFDESDYMTSKRQHFYDLLDLIFNLCLDEKEVPITKIKEHLGSLPNDSLIPTPTTVWKCPKSVPFFYGRTEEIAQLSQRLNESNSIVISGVSGIGKSELVKKYIDLHKDEFTNVLFVPFNISLKETIAQLELGCNTGIYDENLFFNNNMRYLSTWDNDSILIIDNFNILPENEPLYNELCSFRFKTIFTSTYEYPNSLYVREFGLYTGALSIFNSVCPRFSAVPFDDDIIHHLLEEVECHTYAIVLIGMLLQNSPITPPELLTELQNNLLQTNNTEVTSSKDETTTTTTVFNHIQKIIDIAYIQSQADIPDYMFMYCCFIPKEGVSLQIFSTLSGTNSVNYITRLRRLGMIIVSDNQDIYIHSIVRNSICNHFEISYTSCFHFIATISQNVEHSLAIQDMEQLFRLIQTVSVYVKCKNEPEAVSFAYDLEKWINFFNENGHIADAYALCLILQQLSSNYPDTVIPLLSSLSFAATYVQSGHTIEAQSELDNAAKLINYINDNVVFPEEFDHIPAEFKYQYNIINASLNKILCHYKKAIIFYNIAIEIATSLYSPNDKSVIASKFHLAKCYLNCNNTIETHKLLNEIEQSCKILDYPHSYHAELHKLFGMCFASEGNEILSTEHHQKNLQCLISLTLHDTPIYYRSLLDYALSDIKTGNYRHAKDTLLETIDWFEQNNPETHKLELFEAHNDLSFVYYALGNFEKCYEVREKAKSFHLELYPIDTIAYANFLYQSGELYGHSKNMMKIGLSCYDEVIKLLSEFDYDSTSELSFNIIDVKCRRFALSKSINNYSTVNEVEDLFNTLRSFDITRLLTFTAKKGFITAYICCCFDLWYRGQITEINQLSAQLDSVITTCSEEEI